MSVAKQHLNRLHAFRSRCRMRTVVVVLVIHALASWTFLLINQARSYALAIPPISHETISTPVWIPPLLLYELISLFTSISSLTAEDISKCAFDWLAYLLPLLGWWGLWRLSRATIRCVQPSVRPIRWRRARRIFSIGSLGLAMFLVVNALALHWGIYVTVWKSSLNVGVYQVDGCAILLIKPIHPTGMERYLVFHEPQGITWEPMQHWPTSFWLSVKLPLWIASVPFAALSLLAHYDSKRDVTNATLCKKCGYDLRAHLGRNQATGSKCPECGTLVPKSAHHSEPRKGSNALSPLAFPFADRLHRLRIDDYRIDCERGHSPLSTVLIRL